MALAGRSEVFHSGSSRLGGPAVARIRGGNGPDVGLGMLWPPHVHAASRLPYPEAAHRRLNSRWGPCANPTCSWHAQVLPETHRGSATTLAESSSVAAWGGHGPSLYLAVMLGHAVADLADPTMVPGVIMTVLVVVTSVAASSVVPPPAPAPRVPMTVGPVARVPVAGHPGVAMSEG